MGMRRILVAGLMLLAMAGPSLARPLQPDDDPYVPDSKTAVTVAEIIIKRAIGEDAYEAGTKDSPVVDGSPLQAELKGGIWYVSNRPGEGPQKAKNRFIIGIVRHDARVVKVSPFLAQIADMVPDAPTAIALGEVIIRRNMPADAYADFTKDSPVVDGSPLRTGLEKGVWYVYNRIPPRPRDILNADGSGTIFVQLPSGFSFGIAKRDGRITDVRGFRG